MIWVIIMNFFDLHCDTPTECFKKKTDFYDLSLAVNGSFSHCFSRWTQCFAVFIRDGLANPYDYCKNVLNYFKRCLKEKPENLTPVFTVEGGSVLENNIERLDALKHYGIRALTLTWNGENAIAHGADTCGGLKPFGKCVIKRLNELNMACDLSHLNRESFFEAAEYAEYPLATHSCCDAVNSHRRNLTDGQIKLIAEKKGIIGICLYPVFLGDGNVFENVYRHIYHLLDMGFEDNISIGSDFDGAQMNKFLRTAGDVKSLYEYLISRGIEKGLSEKIFYNNAAEFFNKIKGA